MSLYLSPSAVIDRTVIAKAAMSTVAVKVSALEKAKLSESAARGAHPEKKLDNSRTVVPQVFPSASHSKMHASTCAVQDSSTGSIIPPASISSPIHASAGCLANACIHYYTSHGWEECLFCGRMWVLNCDECDAVCGWCPCPEDDMLSSVPASKENM